MRFLLRACLLIAIVGFVHAADSAPSASDAAAPSDAAGEPSKEDYTLQPSDLIQVQVFQEDDLTREVRVSQESTITLPLIGTLSVKGMSVRQLEQTVRDLYGKDYLVNPNVTIVVKTYSVRTVDVQGQVGKPGAVEFPQEKGMTLLGAITRAGGFTRLADKSKVMLTRRMPDGHLETYKIDATEIIQGKSQNLWPLQGDDSIYVQERIL